MRSTSVRSIKEYWFLRPVHMLFAENNFLINEPQNEIYNITNSEIYNNI